LDNEKESVLIGRILCRGGCVGCLEEKLGLTLIDAASACGLPTTEEPVSSTLCDGRLKTKQLWYKTTKE